MDRSRIQDYKESVGTPCWSSDFSGPSGSIIHTDVGLNMDILILQP